MASHARKLFTSFAQARNHVDNWIINIHEYTTKRFTHHDGTRWVRSSIASLLHCIHLEHPQIPFLLDRNDRTPRALWSFSSSLSQSTPLSGKPLAIPKKMPWICATCSSLLWRHREWWLVMGVISDGFNGGCPALSAQGSLTIRLPLASLSVSLAESWQIFDIFDIGGGQGVHTKTQGNWYILIILIYVVIMTMCSTFSLAESGENVGWRNLFI